MKYKTCSHCEKEIDATAKFCPKCGYNFKDEKNPIYKKIDLIIKIVIIYLCVVRIISAVFNLSIGYYKGLFFDILITLFLVIFMKKKLVNHIFYYLKNIFDKIKTSQAEGKINNIIASKGEKFAWKETIFSHKINKKIILLIVIILIAGTYFVIDSKESTDINSSNNNITEYGHTNVYGLWYGCDQIFSNGSVNQLNGLDVQIYFANDGTCAFSIYSNILGFDWWFTDTSERVGKVRDENGSVVEFERSTDGTTLYMYFSDYILTFKRTI